MREFRCNEILRMIFFISVSLYFLMNHHGPENQNTSSFLVLSIQTSTHPKKLGTIKEILRDRKIKIEKNSQFISVCVIPH